MKALSTILAAGALAVTAGAASAATIYASQVIDAHRSAGNPSCTGGTAACKANDRLNTANAVDNNANTFYSLGFGGDLTVGFGGTVFNPTQNLVVTEITFSSGGTTPPTDGHFEAVEIFAVLNGTVGKSLGVLYNWGKTSVVADVAFDAIKLVDVTRREFTKTTSYDGFDVSAVAVAPVPLPAAGLLLLGSLGGLAALRRRNAA